MTHEEVLTKAIDLAMANGWQPLEGIENNLVVFTIGTSGHRVVFSYKAPDKDIPLTEYSVYGLLFSHSFTNAIFGTEDIDLGTLAEFKDGPMRLHGCAAWYWHLQQMVVEDDPIAYLAQHLPEVAA